MASTSAGLSRYPFVSLANASEIDLLHDGEMNTYRRLAAALPNLGAGLAGSAARERLLRAASRCPIVSGFGVECALHQTERLDLIQRFASDEHQRARCFGVTVPPPIRETTLYAEIDLPERTPQGVGLFIGAGDSGRGKPIVGTSLRELLALADWLGEGNISQSTRRFLAGRITALPEQLWIGYLGRFSHRDPKVIRMTVSGLHPAALPVFLPAYGAKHLFVPEGLVAALDGLAVRVVISLDVLEDFGETLGIEISPRTPEHWPECLCRLQRFARFSATQIGALCAWRGLTHSGGEVLARRLNHLKLICKPGQQLSAKAYFYVALIGNGRNDATTRPTRAFERQTQ